MGKYLWSGNRNTLRRVNLSSYFVFFPSFFLYIFHWFWLNHFNTHNNIILFASASDKYTFNLFTLNYESSLIISYILHLLPLI